jgi:hypothetical protein
MTLDTIREVGIRLFSGFVPSEKDRGEIEAEGKVGAASGGRSLDTTTQLISFVYNNVDLTVSHVSCRSSFYFMLVPSKAEAGYSMLIDIMLLHIASTMHGQQKVDIFPNIPAEATFETDYGNRSFSGVIDYLLSCVPDGASSDKFALYSLFNYPTSSYSDHHQSRQKRHIRLHHKGTAHGSIVLQSTQVCPLFCQ